MHRIKWKKQQEKKNKYCNKIVTTSMRTWKKLLDFNKPRKKKQLKNSTNKYFNDR